MASIKSSDPRLDPYTVLKRIGKGSYGEVFLVKHSKAKKQFVMKNIKLTASSAKERMAAEQEAVLLSGLRHPNIVSYRESFQDEHGVLHIIMGFCEGGDLCSRLKACKGQLLPETQVVEWFVQIALALQYLHQRNILHRDLKTQNIFLSKNDIIKVGDLGIARVLDGSCDLAHTVIGTPYYMSPELFANQPYNYKSDIWALGCCVHEMATLKHAFSAKNLNALMYQILRGQVPALPNTFSNDLSQLVGSMMAHNADSRPSVHQLLRNPFIRRHIKLFLDRSASKRKGSGKEKPSVRELELPVSQQLRAHGDNVTGSGKENKKSSSLISLSQDSVESGDSDFSQPVDTGQQAATNSSQEAVRNKHSNRPPRPLPPDPIQESSSKVMSARERRRRNKQLEGGSKRRVVLKSRSAQSVQSSAPTTIMDRGAELPLPSSGSSHEVDELPLPSSGSSHEVDEFMTLLDSTLHQREQTLEQRGCHTPKEITPTGQQTSEDTTPTELRSPSESTMLQSGRLEDRIIALRRDCVQGLGEVLVREACDVLQEVDSEEAEVLLLKLLGEQNFSLFAAKLQHLNFCEENVKLNLTNSNY